MTLSDWDSLDQELDRWQETNRRPKIWWRDDDARKAGDGLQRLAMISAGLPVALAVIPQGHEPALKNWIDTNFNHAYIFQHGWSHRNYAFPDEKKAEYSAHRALKDMFRDILQGHNLLHQSFASRYLPVFVPPWNRMPEDLISHLLKFGPHQAVSLYGPQKPGQGSRLNSHVDIINWQQGRGFIGREAALRLLVFHLQAQRKKTGPTEAIGLLTHHMNHNADCWQFLETFVRYVKSRPDINWIQAGAGS